ncbi:MAG TPA: ABC transporter ATP-binding protein [Candidatus Eisenbacteria bacterium]|nr:ABC transporter ATP-binding protein [Candidatus Eisenbacteria bacterium]
MDKIRVVGLKKAFGATVAVDEVSFAIGHDEFFSLLGPSGCGKSTTLRCVAGLEEPGQGEILIGDAVVHSTRTGVSVPTEERPIGMVFQNYAVWPHMTVRENVAYPLKIKKVSTTLMKEKLEAALESVGLSRLADRYPNQLSGGEQQRVALARALVKEPEVLLLDEPLSNLDAKLREHMRFELKELQRRSGIPILYVTHDQAEALAMSDRLAVMNAGRIVQIGTPPEIYSNPADRFVADFIGLMNFLPCSVISRNGETAVVEFHGARVEVPNPGGHRGRCVLAVRPEAIRLARAGAVPCRVEIRSFLGNLIDYRVRAGGEILRVQTPSHVVFDEGDELALTIERAMLFGD